MRLKRKGQKEGTDLEIRVREHVDDLSGLSDVIESLTMEPDQVGISKSSSIVLDGEGGLVSIPCHH